MSTRTPIRRRTVILTGMLLLVIVIGSLQYVYLKNQAGATPPITYGVYVSDHRRTKIYGPGTPEQARVVKWLESALGNIKPGLYLFKDGIEGNLEDFAIDHEYGPNAARRELAPIPTQ